MNTILLFSSLLGFLIIRWNIKHRLIAGHACRLDKLDDMSFWFNLVAASTFMMFLIAVLYILENTY